MKTDMVSFKSLLGLLAVAVCKLVGASLVPEEEGLSIVYPRDARRNMYVAMADFGMPKYGGFLSGELVFLSSQGRSYKNKTYNCAPRACDYGCDLNTISPPFSIQKEPGQSYIMLVDRGPNDDNACYFLDKVYNAQMAGADAVLVANYYGENLTTAIAPDTDDTAAQRFRLTVSAGMISYDDAQILKRLLANLSMTGGGKVELLLNWTKSLPQSTQVAWEFWTGSEDVCGAMCAERTNFTAAIKDQAVKFEQAAMTKFTPRYFMYACKAGTNNDTDCVNNCFSNGRYCGWPTANNYTGKDVLRMNLRAKCLFVKAASANQGHLWWEYATRFARDCSITSKTYNAECAGKVFDSLGAISSKSDWEACATVNEADAIIPILEEEIQAQYGNFTDRKVAEIKINPSIRINGEQYRGSLEAGPVLRALCAAFPSGHEPGVCNSPTISDDECAGPNGAGYVKCKVGVDGNRSRCINTFQGYQCACGSGFQLVFEPGDFLAEACDDINECLVSNAPLRNPACTCRRCACVNLPGSYNCTGELPDLCTAANSYNGCWSGTFDGTTYSNCVDNILDFQALAVRGLVTQANKTWAKCGDCPRCFRPVSDPRLPGGFSCEPLCDLSQCDKYSGYCSAGGGGGGGGSESKDDGGKTAGGGGGGGGGGKSSSSGVHPGFLVVVALGAAALTGVVVMAANHIMMRRRMGEEIREIMGAYMPLQEERARSAAAAAAAAGARGVGGGGARGGRDGGAYQERIIRPDEDSDEEGGVGPYGWSSGNNNRTAAAQAAPAAAPLGPLGGGGGGGSAAAAPAPTLVGASQRAVWGPPATSAAPAAASSSAAAPAPASAAAAGPTFGSPIPLLPPKPTVEAVAAAPAAAAAPVDADPLLGMALTSSSRANLDAGAGKGKSKDGDNPFL